MLEICCFEHIICFSAANKQAFLWKNLLINAAFGMLQSFPPRQTPHFAHSASLASTASPQQAPEGAGRTRRIPPAAECGGSAAAAALRKGFASRNLCRAPRPADFGGPARRSAFRLRRNALGGGCSRRPKPISRFAGNRRAARRAFTLSHLPHIVIAGRKASADNTKETPIKSRLTAWCISRLTGVLNLYYLTKIRASLEIA